VKGLELTGPMRGAITPHVRLRRSLIAVGGDASGEGPAGTDRHEAPWRIRRRGHPYVALGETAVLYRARNEHASPGALRAGYPYVHDTYYAGRNLGGIGGNWLSRMKATGRGEVSPKRHISLGR